jgi:hypothetical protein
VHIDSTNLGERLVRRRQGANGAHELGCLVPGRSAEELHIARGGGLGADGASAMEAARAGT